MERLVSQRLLISIRIPFQNQFIPRAISHANAIFWHSWVKRGSKLAISRKMTTRSWILHRYITLHQKFDCGIYFCQATFFVFWGGALLRLNGGKKGQKLPIPLNMTPRSCKFGQRYNASSQIWYRDSIRTNCNFLLFFGHPAGYMVKKGQKMRIALKLTPRSCKFVQRDNFWREIWYWHSFRTN